jgi:hypothetical protein
MPFTGNNPEHHEGEIKYYRRLQAQHIAELEKSIRARGLLAWWRYLIWDQTIKPLLFLGGCLVIIGILAALLGGILKLLQLIFRYFS